ncbi:UDP-glycosyltransferase 87A1-like [Prosopis cineraria]|uniref:UDP-glycosyltransferase 87A1-like n=1 Tax=Prosopis cineraria TaxID=364024 RepID=UPI00240F0409|nr:UDP-glycosyltransferase 87A1-like [Prosopis cineraria]
MAYHVLAVPYPGRGHANPMMNLCKILASLMASHDQEILITFVVTEERQGLLGSDQTRPNNLTISTVPNVLPSELVRGSNFLGFYEATRVTLIIAEAELQWAVPLANRWNIPVAILWTSSASVFSMFLHFHLLRQNEHLGINLSGRLRNLKNFDTNNRVLQLSLQCISRVKQAQYLLMNSIYELETQVIDILKGIYSFPVYSVGPAIPFLDMNNDRRTEGHSPNYMEWRAGKWCEILVGGSRRQLMVEARFRDKRLFVSWCEQLRVLCHSSVGEFLSHCGWISVLEATFAGVPILTFPIYFDQTPNGKQIVEDWKVGWRGRERKGADNVVTREEISMLVARFMNPESTEHDELRRRAKQIQGFCRRAIAEGGTSSNSSPSLWQRERLDFRFWITAGCLNSYRTQQILLGLLYDLVVQLDCFFYLVEHMSSFFMGLWRAWRERELQFQTLEFCFNGNFNFSIAKYFLLDGVFTTS